MEKEEEQAIPDNGATRGGKMFDSNIGRKVSGTEKGSHGDRDRKTRKQHDFRKKADEKSIQEELADTYIKSIQEWLEKNTGTPSAAETINGLEKAAKLAETILFLSGHKMVMHSWAGIR